jgi:hypothetical protein
MSFIIDPPLLLLSGLAIYLLDKRMEWSRHAKIVVGLSVALIFVIFSVFLYTDIICCPFPFCSHIGSEFMFHCDITHITKSMVPKIVVLFLFLLYPFWILAGYACPMLLKKRRVFPRRSTHTLMSRARKVPMRRASAISKTTAISMNPARPPVSMTRRSQIKQLILRIHRFIRLRGVMIYESACRTPSTPWVA